ncbi:MAG: glycosyltransferase family 4 protein [Pseudolabrys sp.]|nr:glycosyltransferase family 4 protein [Pseudolabrys sp.]
MPRIIFLNRYFYPDHSATSQILSDLAFHLAEAGRDVHIVTSRQLYDDASAALPEREVIRGVKVWRVATTVFGRATLAGRALDYLSCYRGMHRAIGKLSEAGDIIVAKTDPPLLSVVAAHAAKRSGAHVINWLQDLYPEAAVALGVPLIRGPLAALLTRLRNTSLHRAKINIVPGEAMAQRLEAHGIAADKIRVIANWTDDEAIVPMPAADNPLRVAWGLGGKFVVGYSGNFGRAHDFGAMLGAAQQLRQDSRIVFVLIGGGSQLNALKRKVRDSRLEDTVRFFPYQPRDMLPSSLALPDVHWLSLRPELEGVLFPSKFYGIAAAGRPIIALASPHGEIAKLLDRHQCGFTADPADSSALAAHLKSLAGDPAQCATLGRRARAMVDAELTRRHAFDQWRQVIERIA